MNFLIEAIQVIFKKWIVDEKIDFWLIMSEVILKIAEGKLNILYLRVKITLYNNFEEKLFQK